MVTTFTPALPIDRVQGGGNPATDINNTNARVNSIATAVNTIESSGGGGGGGGGSAPTRVFIPAVEMVATNGPATLITADGEVPGVQFWEVAQGQGVGGVTIGGDTTGWSTARLDLHWFKRSGDSGTLFTAGRAGSAAPGDVIGTGGPGDPVSIVAGATSAYKVSSLGTLFSGGPGLTILRMYRFDTAAGDTLGTTKIGVLGLSLTKLT